MSDQPRSQSEPSGKKGLWLTVTLAIGAFIALLATFILWGERAFGFLLAFVVLLPAALISALMRWLPRHAAEGVRGGTDWGRRLNITALGLSLASLMCLVIGVAWFGTAPGTMLLVAGTMLLPPAVILSLLALSVRDRERLSESHLEASEEIVYLGEVHWGVFLPTILVLTLVLLLVVAPLGTTGYVLATILYLVVLPATAAYALSVFFNTELELTPSKLLVSTGLVVRTSRVLERKDLQAVGVNQGWLGRALGYGRVSFVTREGSSFKVPGIVDPEGLRHILMRGL